MLRIVCSSHRWHFTSAEMSVSIRVCVGLCTAAMDLLWWVPSLTPLCPALPGEAGGLRVPRAGLDPQKRPCWLVQAAVFCSARPQLHGSRELAEEAAEEAVPMVRLTGSHALEKAAYLKPIRREEKYLRSSLQALHEPAPQGGTLDYICMADSGCRPCLSSHLDVRLSATCCLLLSVCMPCTKTW